VRAGGAWTGGARARLKVFELESVSLSYCSYLWFSLFSYCFFLIMCTGLIFMCHRGRWVAGGSYTIFAAHPEVEGTVKALSYCKLSEYSITNTNKK